MRCPADPGGGSSSTSGVTMATYAYCGPGVQIRATRTVRARASAPIATSAHIIPDPGVVDPTMPNALRIVARIHWPAAVTVNTSPAEYMPTIAARCSHGCVPDGRWPRWRSSSQHAPAVIRAAPDPAHDATPLMTRPPRANRPAVRYRHQAHQIRLAGSATGRPGCEAAPMTGG